MRLIKNGIVGCLLALIIQGQAVASTVCHEAEWPLWAAFKTHFIQDSGRVLDASTAMQHSSSEGQSYGMFFALVANDRPTFDHLWQWAINNLSAGDASRSLAAWIWGKAEDGTWRVLDENSASDANLWFAYALLEAGRLWQEPSYTHQAHALLNLIETQEIATLPELGKMLLPGKDWFFNAEAQTWQLNASYLPVPVLRRLALDRPNGPWSEIAANTAVMMHKTSPKGFAPNWTMYQAKDTPASFIVDTNKGPDGSYDAIRNYLWAGMTHPTDPVYARILKSLSGMIAATKSDPLQLPPETVNTQTGALERHGPFGFSAALLPYFVANKQPDLLKVQTQRVREGILRTSGLEANANQQPPYYDYVLSLFGLGWLDKMYRFQRDGSLRLSWGKGCLTTTD